MFLTQKYMIRRSADHFRDKPAMVFEDQSLTFGEVNDRANRLANALGDLGLKPGDRVATLTMNCLQYAEIMFGLTKGAFPQLTLNPRLPADEMAFQIDECEVSAIIVHHHYAEVIQSIREQAGRLKHVICFEGASSQMLDYEHLLSTAKPEEPPVELNLDDLGEIHYSGGTTGRPKGILLPYRNKLAVTRNILLDCLPDLSPKDNFMALQPLYHGAGWFLTPAWVRGATHYIVPRFDAESALDAIEKRRITVIKTIPTLLLRLLDAPDIKKRDLSSIRTLVYGAEPMLASRLKEALKTYGAIFVQIYGQMEAAASISILTKDDHQMYEISEKSNILSSAGRAMTFVDVKVVGEQDKELPRGEEGEVIVKGDHTMIGYLNRPEATAEKKRDEWIYTGDLGMIDKDGYIFLTGGRKSEMIISGGLNIYPNEVEQVILKHPAVKEAAVIGEPDPKWGESVKSCVVLREGQQAREEELLDFCKGKLAGYKHPRSIDFVSELPRTGAGKIAYGELRKRYCK